MAAIKNPIIPGFYPDPSICRVGDDFYLACSSFEEYPGIPIFHSKDLMNWEQISYAMTAENGFHVERNCMNGGVMAPTLRYHDGTFYIINTNFSHDGNYIVTASDPAGPWSEPHWLKDVPGIDASIFFDDDGQCYVMGTGDNWPDGKGGLRQGIWVARFDLEHYKMASEPVAIYGGAFADAASPESPHIYHIGDYYYLLIAEGGTEHYHSASVARSKNVFGPYENDPANPVITHRHMGYHCPIGNVGHADLVELPDGSWYAVMLASRLVDGVSKNLGRETYICPVVWERGWPLFSPRTGKLEWEYPAPDLPEHPFPPKEALDDFDSPVLGLDWSFWGRPYTDFWRVEDSKLYIRCIAQAMAEPLRPMSFVHTMAYGYFAPALCQRQLEPKEFIACEMNFVPEGNETAGLVVRQAMNHQYRLELANVDGRQLLRLILCTSDFDVPAYIPSFKADEHSEVLAETEWAGGSIVLALDMDGNRFTFSYGSSREERKVLAGADGFAINPEKVGCMTGTMIGVFASGNGTDSHNEAAFSWFEHRQKGSRQRV